MRTLLQARGIRNRVKDTFSYLDVSSRLAVADFRLRVSSSGMKVWNYRLGVIGPGVGGFIPVRDDG
jgi:hypothetical protein